MAKQRATSKATAKSTGIDEAEVEFGKIRSFLWPIHNHELKKIIPMLLMFFFISFNYSVFRGLKDTFVINAPGADAEIIPFLKVWLVVPMAFLFMILFAKAANVFKRETLFYVSVAPFIVFFALFAFVLYPWHEYLHLDGLAETMTATLPSGLKGFIAMCRNWTFSLFYVFAELWGSVVLSLLFWGFANHITMVSESKRFYALLGIGANFAGIVAGSVSKYYGGMSQSLIDNDGWSEFAAMQLVLTHLTILFLISVASIYYIYWWMNRKVLTDKTLYDPSKIKKKKSKPKMSLSDSFKFILSSKYLGCIAILVIAYGISINLIEVTWKNQVKEFTGGGSAYLSFQGNYQIAVSATTIFLMLFVTGNVVRKLGWTFAALITPVVLLATGAVFFGVIIFKDWLEPMLIEMGTTALTVAVVFGTIQNVASKASKYSLFDPTKEMTYIPLDEESKVKGKAAVDVVGARLGKAGGSVIQQGLFQIGSLAQVTSYIAVMVFVVIGAWIFATTRLGQSFDKAEKEQEK